MLQRTLLAGFIAPVPSNYPLTDRLQFDILRSGPGWRGPDAIRSVETARVHQASRWRGGMAAGGWRAAAGVARDRVSKLWVAGVRHPPADRPTARFEPNRLR